MRTIQLLLKQITKLGFLLMVGASMSACAGLTSHTMSWKEEVKLHDGRVIVAERFYNLGGYTFVSGDRTSGGDLIVDGAILIKNYNPNTGNHMGISFSDAVAQANPQTTNTINGDLTPGDPDPAHQQPDGAAHAWTDTRTACGI